MQTDAGRCTPADFPFTLAEFAAPAREHLRMSVTPRSHRSRSSGARTARLRVAAWRALALCGVGLLVACAADRTGLATVDGGGAFDAAADGGPDRADGGDVDAGGSDAGDGDAGTPDAGTSDAGGRDGGATDAGGADAGCIAMTELCNGRDDDCDGDVDEDFALASDPVNCGACGVACDPGLVCASSLCVAGNAVVQVAAGSNFTCARLAGGAVYCWGAGADGQLGRGSTADSNVAVPVTGLDDAIDLGVGNLHACAVRAGGTVVCWGKGQHGRLGNGAVADATTPVSVSLGDVVRVGVGGEHACAIRADGALYCWGRDDRGQLGQAGADRSTPGAVTLEGPALDVSGGLKHTCVALRDGLVRCFGENGSGQVGDGMSVDRAAPVAVGALDAVVEVALGGDFSCARTLGAVPRVACWGDNAGGQLADGTTTDNGAPRDVAGVTEAIRITAGGLHACALRRGGAAECWGSNGAGRLGDGTTTDRRMPVPVALLGRAVHISAGEAHTCAARTDGSVACWGTGADGRLGNGGTADAVAPVRVMGLP